MTRASVITLTWNHLACTRRALESLRPILHSDDELIVVDNNSADGTQGYLSGLTTPCPVRLHFSDTYLSIVHAYNAAINLSSGEYIFIYDNDLEIVEKGTLDHMIGVLSQDPAIGIVLPHCDNIIGCPRSIPGPAKKVNSLVPVQMKRKAHWPACASAAWLIRREVIDKVGLFDERFSEYGFGDLDYARRVLEAGYKIILDGFIFVKHYGSRTVSDADVEPQLRRMRALFWEKWLLPPEDTRPERFRRPSHVQ
jgi:GT2 family glycosyltransferase